MNEFSKAKQQLIMDLFEMEELKKKRVGVNEICLFTVAISFQFIVKTFGAKKIALSSFKSVQTARLDKGNIKSS